MLPEQDRHQQHADRAALSIWLAGDKVEPFVLPRRAGYDVCSILLPSPASRITLVLRVVAEAVIRRIPSSAIKLALYRLLGVRIGRDVYIAPQVILDPVYPRLIELNDGCFLGAGCKVLAHEYTATQFRMGRTRIGAGSVVGAFSIVRGGVTIGQHVTTGLGSVVLKNVPDGRTVVGNPARSVWHCRETA